MCHNPACNTPTSSRAKWCSEKCRMKVRNKGKRQYEPQANCKMCGKPNPTDARGRQNKVWCSKQCSNIWTTARQVGISIEECITFYRNVPKVCSICKVEETSKRLSLDHDHVTGKLRGLLCTNCNLGIGCFKDNPYLILSAADYLHRTSG